MKQYQIGDLLLLRNVRWLPLSALNNTLVIVTGISHDNNSMYTCYHVHSLAKDLEYIAYYDDLVAAEHIK